MTTQSNIHPFSMHIPSRHKSLFILLTVFAGTAHRRAIVPYALAEEKKLVAIIVPSPENPFFKALADAAEEKAKSLGYETLILVHNDDPVKQAQLFETAIARKAGAIIVDNAGADATACCSKEGQGSRDPVVSCRSGNQLNRRRGGTDRFEQLSRSCSGRRGVRTTHG